MKKIVAISQGYTSTALASAVKTTLSDLSSSGPQAQLSALRTLMPHAQNKETQIQRLANISTLTELLKTAYLEIQECIISLLINLPQNPNTHNQLLDAIPKLTDLLRPPAGVHSPTDLALTLAAQVKINATHLLKTLSQTPTTHATIIENLDITVLLNLLNSSSSAVKLWKNLLANNENTFLNKLSPHKKQIALSLIYHPKLCVLLAAKLMRRWWLQAKDFIQRHLPPGYTPILG